MMEKRKLIIVVGLVAIALLILAIGIMFFRLRKLSPLLSPLTQEAPEVEMTQLVTWEDPAGFSFSYPENIKIDPHEGDTENYSHLELTNPDYSGNILIWVKDTNYLTIEDWVEEEVGEGAQVFDTELGGEPAKKVAFTEPGKLITATIDVDALVLVEMVPDEEGYWQEIYNQILSSFTFIPLGGEEAIAPGPWEGAGGAGGIIEEPEEVIE